MINVYINYPQPHATIHRDPNCGFIHRRLQGNFTRRQEDISQQTLSSIVRKFDTGEIQFRASAGLNGIWLRIDLADEPSEIAVVDHILKVLGIRYTPFRGVVPIIHRCNSTSL